KIKTLIPQITISVPLRDNEAWQYRKQFDEVFLRVGIVPEWIEHQPRGLDEEGVIIAAKNVKHLTEGAQRFREMLEIADIHTKIVQIQPAFEHLGYGHGF